MRYQRDRSFHFGKKRQARRLRRTGDGAAARQLALLQPVAQSGNVVREAHATIVICRIKVERLIGTNYAQAGRKIDQTSEFNSCDVHLCDEFRRITGAEQLSSRPGSAMGRIRGYFLLQIAADWKIVCNLP